jgi:hypothetical protein
MKGKSVKVSTLIEQIDLGKLALPEFQRGYVWSPNQVRGLMTSLYRHHPVGSLLVWETAVDQAAVRGDGAMPTGGWVDLLLDGQQRITSLYGIVRGRPPRFFDGNPASFTNLRFNVADETFEFYAPVKMRDNPLWIDVTRIMQSEDFADLLEPAEARMAQLGLKPLTVMSRLQRVQNIKNVDFHIERVSGEDKSIDVVVEIFNRVNSGGTTLSKGDLALAKICASWPEARDEMKDRLAKWRHRGYGDLKLEWFLRAITAITTGEAFFSSLSKIDTARFQQGVQEAEWAVDKLFYTIGGRLGLDHGEVLKSVYALPLLSRLLYLRKELLSDPGERDKMLYWYVNTLLWGRYSGSTETVLSQDLRILDEPGGELDRLIAQLRQWRGDLTVRPDDFRSWGRGARFYPLLYMLTRTLHARDLDSGLDLQAHHLGHLMSLQLHHIFPKAKLYKHGYQKSTVNDLANFMFLTQETNLKISDRDPAEYFAHYEAKHPGILGSHWIPMDQELWTYERYPDFLAARRELLAKAANDFLRSLYEGTVQPRELPEEQPAAVVPATPTTTVQPKDEEDSQLLEVMEWMEKRELPAGELYYELTEPETGELRAVFDLAWPEGVQEGLSQPVTILLNEESDVEEAANAAGFRFFTDVGAFKEYVEEDLMGDEEVVAAD